MSYAEFFLSAARDVVELQLLEISHPSFSQTYFAVRNARAGVTVTHEDAVVQAYTYYPMKILLLGSRGDLDTGISVSFSDLGETLPKELDAIDDADLDVGYITRPMVKYRVYRSDDLSAPLYGPQTLQMQNIAFNRKGVTFQAKPPKLNVLTTGELYTLDRFPMLRGFL